MARPSIRCGRSATPSRSNSSAAGPTASPSAQVGDRRCASSRSVPPAVHTTRASFAKNLFEAGGIRAPSTAGAADATEAAAAFRASGAALACICSSDRVYADLAVDVATAVAAAVRDGCTWPGRPEGLADDLAGGRGRRAAHRRRRRAGHDDRCPRSRWRRDD